MSTRWKELDLQLKEAGDRLRAVLERLHMPSYETGYREGGSSVLADFDIALTEHTEYEGEILPVPIAQYIEKLESELSKAHEAQ